MPPETQFFSVFLPELDRSEEELSREEMVSIALTYPRIGDLGLCKAEVLERFERYPLRFSGLLRSLLEVYSEKRGKAIPGEKSPAHLMSVPTILSWYPYAKIICVVRDGRDVVRSLYKAPWARHDNPRRLGLFCNIWNDMACKARTFRERYSEERFYLIRYEDLLRSPEEELRKICGFIGEVYEPGQLRPSANSNVVPDWEEGWKAKATAEVDPSRIGAWKREASEDEILFMNLMMGRALREMEYEDTTLHECSVFKRLSTELRRFPYLKPMRPFALWGLRLARLLRRS